MNMFDIGRKFQQKKFDAILSTYSPLSFACKNPKDLTKVLNQFDKVLGPGGSIFFEVSHRQNIATCWNYRIVSEGGTYIILSRNFVRNNKVYATISDFEVIPEQKETLPQIILNNHKLQIKISKRPIMENPLTIEKYLKKNQKCILSLDNRKYTCKVLEHSNPTPYTLFSQEELSAAVNESTIKKRIASIRFFGGFLDKSFSDSPGHNGCKCVLIKTKN